MNTTELIELAKVCEAYTIDDGVVTSVIFGEDELKQFAQRIEAPHKQRIAELELSLQKQAKAALQGMDSAKRVSSKMLNDAKQIQSSLKPELLDSERQANAVLTEENGKLHQQIEQLREALEDALRYKRADEKLVDIINGIGQQQQKPKHGRQA